MSKYIYALFVGTSLVLFGIGISFLEMMQAIERSSHLVLPNSNCWRVWNYPNLKIWDIDCGDLPELEIVIAAITADLMRMFITM